VTGRVDQVDQELVSCKLAQSAFRGEILTVSLLLDVRNVLLGKGEVHGDGGRLDGDSSVNLVLTEKSATPSHV
jgi:hypothetical protein